MANKRCPSCGKQIAARAQYCIYCSKKFDEANDITAETYDESPESSSVSHSGGKFGLIVSLVSLFLILIVIGLVVLNHNGISIFPKEEPTTTTTVATTTTTRNAARDTWLQSFVGYWYDEASVGKKDIKKQGGYVLYVSDIFLDHVTFDLLSYQGGEDGKIAFASEMKADLVDDTLHFYFDNDGLGHKGEGFLRFVDDAVQMEVKVDQKQLTENEHSLAVYSVFKRLNLPTSKGQDLKELTTFDLVKKHAGKKTADAKKDSKGNKTHTFGGLKAVVNKEGKLTRLMLDYTKLKEKSDYCFECVDGTMTYEVVKTYFGEAEQDYVEQPTDIRVLLYSISKESSVKFTFDADDGLLISVDYKM